MGFTSSPSLQMLRVVSLLLLVVGLQGVLTSFLSPTRSTVSRRMLLSMYSSPVHISSKDVLVTDGLKKRIDGKIGKVLGKLSAGVVTNAQVTLYFDGHRDVTKHTHERGHVVEVVCQMKGGDVVKSEVHTNRDLYTSIDLASHSLCQNLKKFRGKSRSNRSSPEAKIGGSMAEDEVDEDAALFSFDEATLLEN